MSEVQKPYLTFGCVKGDKYYFRARVRSVDGLYSNWSNFYGKVAGDDSGPAQVQPSNVSVIETSDPQAKVYYVNSNYSTPVDFKEFRWYEVRRGALQSTTTWDSSYTSSGYSAKTRGQYFILSRKFDANKVWDIYISAVDIAGNETIPTNPTISGIQPEEDPYGELVINLLENPSFEDYGASGQPRYWTPVGAASAVSDPYHGSFCIQVNDSNYYQQKYFYLDPSEDYAFSCFAKSGGTTTVSGVCKFYTSKGSYISEQGFELPSTGNLTSSYVRYNYTVSSSDIPNTSKKVLLELKSTNGTNAKIDAVQLEENDLPSTFYNKATISTPTLPPNLIKTPNVSDDIIIGDHITSNTISGGNIKVSTITGDKISANTISGGNIIADTITGNEISSATTITAGTGTDVGVLDGAHATYRIYAGASDPTTAPFSVTKAGVLYATGAEIDGTLSATDGTIGGFTITSNTISGNDSTAIHAGQSSYGTGAGFWLGHDGGDYKFSIGSSVSGKYLQWDGINLTISGSLITGIDQGSDPSIQGWQFDGIFSASDYNTIAWTTGTLSLTDGTTYTIDSPNGSDTGNMSALTYIYFDKNVSTTTFQTTITHSNAVGNGKILVAVAEDNDDSGSDATLQVFGGSGGQILTTENLAADTITANEIAANTITASEIVAATITSNEIAANTITAVNIAGSTITGDQIAANTISGERISSATTITAGTGNQVGVLDGAHATYRIYAGASDPATAPFSVTKGGVLYATGAEIYGELTADKGSIGGWDIGSTTLTSSGNSNITLNGLNESISIGDTVYTNSGIQLQLNSGASRLYVGNGSDNYVQFDGENFSWKGNNAELTASGAFVASNATIKSASTGQRIEIDSTSNTLKFFDPTGTNVITIDDSIYGNPGIKYETGVNYFVTSADNSNAVITESVISLQDYSSAGGMNASCYYSGSANEFVAIDGYIRDDVEALTSGQTRIGVKGRAENDIISTPNDPGMMVGLWGEASNGASGTSYGVYGVANSGAESWAGYFADGNVKIENTLYADGDVIIKDNLTISGNTESVGPFISTRTAGSSNDAIIMQHVGAPATDNISWKWSVRNNDEDLWLYGFNGVINRSFMQFDWSDGTHIGGSTNYASFASDGEVGLHGTARVTKDFTIPLSDFNPGAAGPTAAVNSPGIFPVYEFSIGNDIHILFEVPTDCDVSEDLTIEIYWAIDEFYALNTAEVQWSADWRAIAVGEDTTSGGSSGTIDFGDVNIAASQNDLIKTTGTIAAANISQDDLVALNISRVALDDGSNPDAEPYIVMINLKYYVNKLGQAT